VKHVWSVRVRAESRQESRIFARNHAFRVGPPLSFEPEDALPSALEHLIGALAADLIGTLLTYARRRRIEVEAAELSLNCTLENPLVHLGVRGEDGSPAIEEISGVLYVCTFADLPDVDALWQEALQRAPIYNTLAKACRVSVRLVITG
jgi:hypothetical protein